MIKKCFILFLVVGLVGCNKNQSPTEESGEGYFSIAQLLEEQIGLLLSLDAALEKRVITGDISETLELKPKDSTEWKTQLQLFLDADISKPGYAGTYLVEELPLISTLSKTVYSANQKKNSLRIMECTYQGDLLKEIRLELSKNNEVFDFDQELFLYFNLESGKSRLSSFSIKGNESMKLKSDLSFEVKATIVVP